MMHRRGFVLTSAAAIAAGTAHADDNDLMTIGDPTAPLHLVEYASATCPHCAAFHAGNWAVLKSRYVDTGRVRLSLSEMLTPPPPVALAMFQMARCGGANGDEYFRRLGILFERQHQILSTGTIGGVRDALLALGAEWGFDQQQVLTCLNDPARIARIERLIAAADAQGVTSTPSFFLNGQRQDTAFHTATGMTAALDAALAR